MERPQFSDSDIIGKVMDGETGLYEILIRRYNPYLYKIGRSYSYGHEDTQDLMQETFVDAYTALAKFENRASFKTWIVKIMVNNCFRRKQKAGFRNEVGWTASDTQTPLFSSTVDTAQTVMNKELKAIIEQALAEIPEPYRMVFTLREINGMSIAETADVLAISDANVKVRLNRAKGMLRSKIEKAYTPEDIFEFNLIYCDALVEKVMARIHAMESP
jgi:RNA polymerase sigma-70 factor (ECF subfamily)